ncbi:hypothetical protein PGT21_001436 [Puccinia graminis f. sp. tritici]|uniref:Uncharacterized protein n=1 Tax=Puccinia graminis f. sp. tritici TaxID=56615 RepID=A0A5B0M838_PUCGR|nr:hypothetical protein PGT21_001436 [Puccinia graminis f. sp. tritici]
MRQNRSTLELSLLQLEVNLICLTHDLELKNDSARGLSLRIIFSKGPRAESSSARGQSHLTPPPDYEQADLELKTIQLRGLSFKIRLPREPTSS